MKGQEPENIGAVVLVLHPDKKKFLLGKRKNSYKAGWYGMPGGRVEFTESIVTAALRELKEETGLIAKKADYIGVVREQQEVQTFIHFGFVVTDYEGEPMTIEPEKCVEWKWHPISTLPKKLLPGHQGLYELFIQSKKGMLRELLHVS